MNKQKEIHQECLDEFEEYFDCLSERVEIEYYLRENKVRKFSPIETMFIEKFIIKNICEWDVFEYETFGDVKSRTLEIIYSPKIYGKSGKFYYPDFCFEIRCNKKLLYDNQKFLIELDGHVWHEKSPEKVQKDKERERDLIDNGYTLYRFSGKEIYDNVDHVVLDCIQSYLKRITING